MSNNNKGQNQQQADAAKARGVFQSNEAATAAATVQRNDTVGPPQSAQIGGPKVDEEGNPVVEVSAPPAQDQFKLIKVRPLRTEQRVRIGGNWYSFQQGKDTLVPRHVYTLLQSKGLFA